VRNLALYMNRQLLSRILFMQELYRRIVEVHGIVIELGTRWGQNMAIFHSLRGMLEPFNMNRKLVCFDTFEGFLGIESQDGSYEYAKAGGLSVTTGYEEHLQAVLEWHESQSPLASIRRFDIRLRWCRADEIPTRPARPAASWRNTNSRPVRKERIRRIDFAAWRRRSR